MYTKLEPSDRAGAFRKSSFEVLKQIALTLNSYALQSPKESVHKTARQKIEVFSQNPFKNVCKLSKRFRSTRSRDIRHSHTLILNKHSFWKCLVHQVFPATEMIADRFPQLMDKIAETLQYIYDPDMFPEKFTTSREEVPFEIIEKLIFDMNIIQFKNPDAENQPFTFTSIKENTNTSLELLPTEQNKDTIVDSQQMDSHLSETTESDFVSTLLDDRTIFSLHTVNTLLLIDLEKSNKNN